MSVYSDRIKPTDYHIRTYLDDLVHKKYQIPTFQREIVWERDSVKKLWDSVYRFYPIGSILIWKTDLKLQNHRAIGGHVITDDTPKSDYQYILDGQQRTTSLLTSLYGGKIEGRDGFNPKLYFDLTIEDQDDIDDQSYKRRYLFWDEIDDRGGTYNPNTPRMVRYNEGLIVCLSDIIQDFGSVERKLVDGNYKEYDHPIRKRLRDIRDVLDNYRLSFIELKGIAVSEVCQIFERINQAGKPLDIFDIVVAKTFRLQTNEKQGFYLRELIDDFRSDTPGNYVELADITYLQIIAVIINQNISSSGVYNITDRYLNEIKTDQIETVWPGVKQSLKKLFDFFENHLHLKGPLLIPYGYFYMALANYFFQNPNPDYDLLKRYFWYYSFHNEDLLANTTHLRQHLANFASFKQSGKYPFERFLIDRQRLRSASYSSRGRLSRAILALLANQEPRDWAIQDRHVLADVYYMLTDKPNLHHVFPTGYIEKRPGSNKLDSNSLMNIAYLTQITNIKISDKNPVDYLKEFDTNGFDNVLKTHLMPPDIIEWSRFDTMPVDGLDQFIEKRIELIIDQLRNLITGVVFDVIDTSEKTEV
jgi:hypothetical protein